MKTPKILAAVLVLGSAVQVQAAPSPPSVVVVNPPSQPVPIITTVVEPFQSRGYHCFSEGEYKANSVIADVPPGKRLAVQYVSGRGEVPSGQKLDITVDAVSPSPFPTVSHTLPVSLQGTFPLFRGDILAGGEPMTMYVNGGGNISMTIYRSESTGTGCVTVNISGYLTNSP